MKKIFVLTVAMLVSSSSIADAAVGPRREIAIACGDIKLSFVVADKSKNYSQNWILRLDIDDKDTTVLTIKNAGQAAWGPWMKEGDTISFPERYFRWQDNKLSWTRGFYFCSWSSTSGILHRPINGKQGYRHYLQMFAQIQ
jgi:hypothetical protein